jgi:hypothetical protein
MEKVKIKSLNNYEKAFNLLKGVVLLIIVVVCSLAGYMVYKSNESINKLQDSIYVLAPDGEISLAIRSSEKENRFFEYEAHVEKAYKLWYEFDEGSYNNNINKALFMFGNCGKEMLNEYTEQRILQKLQSKNMQLFVEVDSIKFDKKSNPIFGIIYGKQKITRPGGELIRHMDCSFNVIDYDRSHENPHGVKIENWKVINAEKIQ